MGQRVDDFRIRVSEDSLFTSSAISEGFVVILFLSKDCPFDNLYKERITKLKKDFPQHKFIIIGNAEIDGFTQFNSSISLIYQFGIKKTPTAIVAKNNTNGLTILYKGPVDDNAQLPSKVKKSYLKEVLYNPTLEPQEIYIPGCIVH